MDEKPSRSARNGLPADLIEGLADLDESQLRDISAYVQDLIHHDQSTVRNLLDEADDEHVVRVEDRNGYTEVVKTQECSEGCEDCPHGPFVYHVTREIHPDGSEHLHWSFIGRASENAES